jgi:HKD family nuclease
MQKTIQDSIITSLVDKSRESILEFQPKLIFNDHQRGMKVLTSIQKELSSCDEFIFYRCIYFKQWSKCLNKRVRFTKKIERFLAQSLQLTT